ncbi:L,D-transpeptidase family protein [Methylocystis sp. B8]|uniref:L,D-transpeptidase family protein n=1 Tax=Methylocystis sp. B8 TaxID=544938 RepID=UPI0010FE480E|nr:L,D-transpeptidase family protein [Methylocystis sp. B8]TLG76916.1 hypothetical protein FEV16_09265 [Methylocystis sp. B8]
MKLQRRSRAKIFSSALAASAALAAFALGPAPASAQGFSFWELFSAPRREPARDWRRHSEPHHPAARIKSRGEGAETVGAKSPLEAKPEAATLDRPLFMVASIADQHVSVYNHRGLVARSAISTGIAGHPTPKGIFTIIGRERYHRSNIYSGAPMPFMQRVTWSGIAMHLGVVPGHPASHGCIRLPAAFAAKLWGMTRIGERVVISPHEVSPVEFEHPQLPKPIMHASAESEKTDPPAANQIPVAPQQQQQAKAETGGEASNAAKAAPAADSVPTSDIAADERAADPKEQASKAGAGDEAPDTNKAVSDDDPLRIATADATAVSPQEQAERPKAETIVEAAGVAKQETEQPKVDAAGAKVDTAAVDSKTIAPNRPGVNPLQYAQQLRARAAAEAAATSKAVKTLTAEVAIKQQEAKRSVAELSAAEAAQTSAWRKAYTADESYEAAAASAARQREPAEVAEREAPAGAGQAKAKADRLTIAYGKALLAEDAALLAKTNAHSAFDEATARLKEARTVFAPKSAELKDAEQRLDEARAASALATTAQREAERRVMPISILISKKERRIYVRQGLSPLFDAPIEIRDPDTPLGSHLFIATAPKEDGSSLKWSVISMPVRFGDEPSERRKTASAETGASWDLRNSGASATEALERVNIPKDVRDKIAERLWTGGSLIISDQPVSGETGNVGTDLTIKVH